VSDGYNVEGCRQLVVAILALAMNDLVNQNAARQYEAWRWLHSQDVLWVCEELGIDDVDLWSAVSARLREQGARPIRRQRALRGRDPGSGGSCDEAES